MLARESGKRASSFSHKLFSAVRAAATVYTVKNAAGDRRHFTVVDGQVVEHPSYEAGFAGNAAGSATASSRSALPMSIDRYSSVRLLL